MDPAAAHWQDVLQLAFPQFHLEDIWCLSLTSKAAGEFCLDRLADGNYHHARDLLFSAVAAEACMPAGCTTAEEEVPAGAVVQKNQKEKCLQAAVEWFLDADVIPPDLLALDSTRYLCMSDTSYRENLLVAGLEITYEAVVTAARKLTRDLNEWIEECEACDIESEIHHITRAACCSDEMEMDSNFLSTPDIILDHLYLAVNAIGSRSPVADSNACNNIIDLCSLPAAAEITAEAIEPLLHAVVQVCGTRFCSTRDHCEQLRAVEVLCRLDATNTLSNAALCGLLKAAAETLPTIAMIPLFQISAVSHLDPTQQVEVVLTLYNALVANSTRDLRDLVVVNDIIYELVAGIPKASCASLVKALFELTTKDITWPLCSCDKRAIVATVEIMITPGMTELSTPAVLEELMCYVLEKGAQDPRLPESAVAFYLEMLREFPVATELGMEGVAQLLQLAQTLSYSSEIVDELLQLQAVQQQSNQ